jgi:hypothetical protein
MKTPLLLLIGVLLSACAGSPSRYSSTVPDTGPVRERRIILALVEVKADDQQRLKIFEAFDKSDTKLRSIDERSAAVRTAWQKLNPRDPTYLFEAEKLGQRSAELTAERLRAQSDFNQQAAAILKESQWADWTEFLAADRSAREGGGSQDCDDGYGGPVGGRRRRG